MSSGGRKQQNVWPSASKFALILIRQAVRIDIQLCQKGQFIVGRVDILMSSNVLQPKTRVVFELGQDVDNDVPFRTQDIQTVKTSST